MLVICFIEISMQNKIVFLIIGLLLLAYSSCSSKRNLQQQKVVETKIEQSVQVEKKETAKQAVISNDKQIIVESTRTEVEEYARSDSGKVILARKTVFIKDKTIKSVSLSNTEAETGSESIVSKETDINSNGSIVAEIHKESSVATIKTEAVVWCAMASIVLLIIIYVIKKKLL